MPKELRIHLTLSLTGQVDLDIANYLQQFTSGTGQTDRSHEIKRLLYAAIRAERNILDYGRPTLTRNMIRPFIENEQLAIATSDTPLPLVVKQVTKDLPGPPANGNKAAAARRETSRSSSSPQAEIVASVPAAVANDELSEKDDGDDDYDPVSDCLKDMFGS